MASPNYIRILSQTDYVRALTSLRLLGLIPDDVGAKSLTILGPRAPYGTAAVKTEEGEGESKHPGWDASLEAYTGPVTELTTGVPYRCWSCHELNRPVPPKRHYAVIRGREVGVFEGWETVQPLVMQAEIPTSQIPCSYSETFHTQQEAQERWAQALARGEVEILDA